VASQTINQSNSPLTKKTAKNIPQTKNQRLAQACIFESTSALIIALSILETTSNKHKPATIKIMENRSIKLNTLGLRPLAHYTTNQPNKKPHKSGI